MATEDRARSAKSKYSEMLMSNPAVVGVGVECDRGGQYFIKVHLSGGRAPDLPTELDGVPVRAEVTGKYRKQS